MSGSASNAPGFRETVRDFWATRPQRPRRGRKIAGVSAAIGNRYGVDPVLVRVAFIVTALYGGAGIALYLLGWLVLPGEGDPSTQQRGGRRSTVLMVILVLALIPALIALIAWQGLFGVALGLLGLYLLHRHFSDRGGPPTDAATPQAGVTEPNTDRDTAPEAASQETNQADPSEQPGQQQPPSWDPLGTAPFAWDLPEPAEPDPEPARQRPRRSITLVTLALAMIAAGMSVAFGMGPTAVFAVALGVLGAGMVVGAFLHGGRGLIGFAVPVAVLTVLTGSVLTGPWRGFTTIAASPNSIAAVREHYGASLGTVDLDLDQLSFHDGERLRSSAEVGMGGISVALPPNVDAVVHCSADRGTIDCLGKQRSGQDTAATVEDFGADGRGGGSVVLNLTAHTGYVEVTRG